MYQGTTLNVNDKLRCRIATILVYSNALIPIFALLGLFFFPFYKRMLIGFVPVFIGLILFVIIHIFNDTIRLIINNLSRIPIKIYLLLAVGISIVFRLPWVLLHMDPYSDHGFYLSLGRRVMRNWDWEDMVLFPPGPFVYVAASLKIFCESKYAVGIMNVFLSASVVIILYKLGSRFGEKVGRCASLLFAVIPSASVYAGGYGYENLLIFLLSTILLLSDLENSSAMLGSINSWFILIIIGFLCGISALVHPPYLLIILCVGLAWWITGRSVRDVFLKTLTMGTVALLVILPWTYRNWNKFGEFCLISANAGTVFFSANNPQSDGIYSDSRLILPIKPEENQISLDRRRGKLAVQNIMDDPIRFGKLSFKRIVYMWGTDTSGMDFVIGHIPRIKQIMSFFAQIFWATCIPFWMIFTWKSVTRKHHLILILYICQSFLLAKFFIHSLVEPLSRHHLDVLPIILLIVAAGIMGKIENYETR